VRPQSTHEMVLFLEGRGLVERRPDPRDRRELLIEVTPGGRRMVSELMGIRHEWLTSATERDLTRAEREMLTIVAALMQRIASSH
jgi:DNA-binding MarR family transcriptional regulator